MPVVLHLTHDLKFHSQDPKKIETIYITIVDVHIFNLQGRRGVGMQSMKVDESQQSAQVASKFFQSTSGSERNSNSDGGFGHHRSPNYYFLESTHATNN